MNNRVVICRLLSKNAVASDKTKVVMLADDQAKFGEAWAEASSCQEIVDGVLNLVSLIQSIRCYSYEAIALLRSLHSVRYFQNVCENAGELLSIEGIYLCSND